MVVGSDDANNLAVLEDEVGSGGLVVQRNLISIIHEGGGVGGNHARAHGHLGGVGALPQGAGALADLVIELHAEVLEPLKAVIGVVGQDLDELGVGDHVAVDPGLEGVPLLGVEQVGATGSLVLFPLLLDGGLHLLEGLLGVRVVAGGLESLLDGRLDGVAHLDLGLHVLVGAVVDGAADQGVAAALAVLLDDDDLLALLGSSDGGHEASAAAADDDHVSVAVAVGGVLNGILEVGGIAAGLLDAVLNQGEKHGGGDGGAGDHIDGQGVVGDDQLREQVDRSLADAVGDGAGLVEQLAADAGGLGVGGDGNVSDLAVGDGHADLEEVVHGLSGGGVGAVLDLGSLSERDAASAGSDDGGCHCSGHHATDELTPGNGGTESSHGAIHNDVPFYYVVHIEQSARFAAFCVFR